MPRNAYPSDPPLTWLGNEGRTGFPEDEIAFRPCRRTQALAKTHPVITTLGKKEAFLSPAFIFREPMKL